MKDELKNEQKGSILVPFLVGGVVGAGVALLLAPKSGKELRKDIRNLATDTRDTIVAGIDRSKDLYEGARSAVRSAIDAGKTAYVEELDKHRQAA